MTEPGDPRFPRSGPPAGRPLSGGEAPVTQAQREAAVERLTSAFAHDVIEIDEFEQRVADAFRAATRAELVRLTADLPPSVPEATHVPAIRDEGDTPAPMPARVKGVFSSVERGGYVAIPPRVEVVARFANVELDLRSAWFLPGVTEIEIRSLLSNVEIRLPPDVAIDNEGDWVVSSVSFRRPDEHPGQGAAAVVRITGRAVLSNIEVLGRTPKRRGR